MKPDEWLEQMRVICRSRDWDALARLSHDTNQAYAGRCDFEGLRQFYTKVLDTELNQVQADTARITDISQFQTGVATALATAKEKIQHLPSTQGVYFEYFFDGGDSCTGNIFLCSEYSETDDSWGAEFDENGFIEGPEVFEYLNFDPDFEWDTLPSYVAQEYANGLLLAAALEEWSKSGIRSLPFGFANHDNEMVRAPAT